MAILQLKGGTETQVSSYTPADRELVIDTTNYKIVIGDGNTVGGNPVTADVSVADSADKWSTARTIEFEGAVIGSMEVDGSKDISVSLEIGDIDFGTLS